MLEGWIHTLFRIVAIFVKPPIPGHVKTRLARSIGNKAACKIYRRLADSIVDQIKASGIPMAIFFDGEDSSKLPESWRKDSVICQKQTGDNLGKRMVEAFARLFAEGIEQVVLIGSDIVGLDSGYLVKAFDQLNTHDMVIGPALDGGYCLVGFNMEQFKSELFEDTPWSTDMVLELTLKKAATAGLSTALIDALQDIDTIDDLHSKYSMIPRQLLSSLAPPR